MANERIINVNLKKNGVPQERLDEIQELLLQGYTQKQIAEKLGRTQSAIQKLISKYNLKQLTRGERIRHYRPKKLDEVQKLLLEGKSQVQIAELTGVPQSSVSQWIKRYNLKYTPHEYKRGVPSTETLEDIERIRKLLLQEKNLTEIALDINRSPQTVDRWIEKYELDAPHIKRHKK